MKSVKPKKDVKLPDTVVPRKPNATPFKLNSDEPKTSSATNSSHILTVQTEISTADSTGTSVPSSTAEVASMMEGLSTLLGEDDQPSTATSTTETAHVAQTETSSQTKASATAESSSSKAPAKEWTEEEIKRLKHLAKKYKTTMPNKNERFEKVARELGTNRTKKECYNKYKELSKSAQHKKAHKETPQTTTTKPKARASPNQFASDEPDALTEALTGEKRDHKQSIPVAKMDKQQTVWEKLSQTYAVEETLDRNQRNVSSTETPEQLIIDEEPAASTGLHTPFSSTHSSVVTTTRQTSAFVTEISGTKAFPQAKGRRDKSDEIIIDEPEEEGYTKDRDGINLPSHAQATPSIRQSNNCKAANTYFTRPQEKHFTKPRSYVEQASAEMLEDVENEVAELDEVEATEGTIIDNTSIGMGAQRQSTSSTRKKCFLPEDLDKTGKGVGINLTLACAVKELLFGVPAVDHATGERSSAPPLKSFSQSWMRHGLKFTETPKCGWGLIQFAGGPCGALASIQARTVKQLYYTDICQEVQKSLADNSTSDWRDPPESIKRKALVNAIWETLVCAAHKRPQTEASPILALPSASHDCTKGADNLILPSVTGQTSSKSSKDHQKVRYTSDKLTECLKLFEVRTKEDFEDIVNKTQDIFFDTKGPGLVCLVVSAIFSRGIGIPDSALGSLRDPLLRKAAASESATEGQVVKSNGVLGDMDFGLGSSATLIGSHNYATQELVNLLLTGYATSNVFDGTRTLGDPNKAEEHMIVRGVQNPSDIGFLTLFEHYDHVHVGKYLKCPKLPVWVICSESHYTTAFAAPKLLRKSSTECVICDKEACDSNPDENTPLELHYWDGLARQDEPIVFSLKPSSEVAKEEKTTAVGADLDEPPLNLVLRTRWASCQVDWNGVEPWL